MRLARWRWALFLVVFALAFGCGKGMEVEGESGSGDDDATDDDTGPTDPPPAPVDCGRDPSDYSIVLLTWQYNPSDYDLVDNFEIRRREAGPDDWETIAEPEPNTDTGAYQQYEDDTAECDVTYYYRIYAANSAGYSDYCQLSARRNCGQKR